MTKTRRPGRTPFATLSRRDLLTIGAIGATALATPMILRNAGAHPMGATVKDSYDTDILVIGSGFAGTFAAAEASRTGQRVLMLDKGSVGYSGLSPWASDSRPFDPAIYDRDEWMANMSTNCEYINDRGWFDIFMDDSLSIFETLDGWGVHKCKPFERSRVFRRVLEDAGVEIVERVMVTSLLKDMSGRVAGTVGFTFDDTSQECRAVTVKAKATILCTGAGGYKSPGFPNWGQTFDGDAMAYEAGAAITGKEFHDTHGTFSNYSAASFQNWSWAQNVTGAFIMVGAPDRASGGLTIDSALQAATSGVSRGGPGGPGGGAPGGGSNMPPEFEAMARSAQKNLAYKGKGFLARNDLILDFGQPPEGPPPDNGLDKGYQVGGATAGMGVHKSEGVFCADYSCKADGLDGLYVAGDALGSMLCGASYPGRGFSSNGSAIQGRRAAQFASEAVGGMEPAEVSQAEIDANIATMWAPRERQQGYSPDWVTQVLQGTMTPFHILYIKEERRLAGALSSIEYMRQYMVPNLIAGSGHELRLAHETANMLLNAEMKLRAGLFRTESRGTHFREDYPARDDDAWHCWVLLRKGADGSMETSKHMLPEAWKPDATASYRDSYPRSYPGEDAYRAAMQAG
ncbi:FAD-dependent oxidoreductase [Aliiruegeria sabulilitoris]|uniref:FAD-dependent oxidoreductase n=1 Tax=Aliiruegeria sabulilitoris TaxID=1510458 RepID=UPI00083004CD|nr:FAD-binding protein [Aliiruegeria sabulilitoris]NDR59266.1 FAD-binding protein [Pseudoruegeria sp. M32A2M]